MKKLVRFAAMVAVACLATLAAGEMAAATTIPVGKCHRVYTAAPGGEEPVTVEACP